MLLFENKNGVRPGQALLEKTTKKNCFSGVLAPCRRDAVFFHQNPFVLYAIK